METPGDPGFARAGPLTTHMGTSEGPPPEGTPSDPQGTLKRPPGTQNGPQWNPKGSPKCLRESPAGLPWTPPQGPEKATKGPQAGPPKDLKRPPGALGPATWNPRPKHQCSKSNARYCKVSTSSSYHREVISWVGWESGIRTALTIIHGQTYPFQRRKTNGRGGIANRTRDRKPSRNIGPHTKSLRPRPHIYDT